MRRIILYVVLVIFVFIMANVVIPPVLDGLVSRWIYNDAKPFGVTQNKFFKNIFDFIAPGYHLPSPKVIGSRLLVDEYKKVKFRVEQVCVPIYSYYNIFSL